MKRMSLLAIAVVFLFGCSTLYAQNVSKGDTLIVSPVDEDGAPLLGALNMAIHADTTATGERAHKVYKLQRNAQYILTEVINADFPLEIVAEEPDDTYRPPIVRCGLNAAGNTVGRWWDLYDDATFKNIWCSGINLDGTGPIAWICQIVHATGKTISFEGCILEAPMTWWAMFADFGAHNTYKTTDCIFMNVGNPSGTTWNGAIFNGGTIDSIVHKNTTFYKFGCFAANGQVWYTEFDHCTLVNAIVHPHNNHDNVIQKFTNNVFVNCHAFSDDYDEIKRHFDGEVKGLMNYAEIQWDPQELDSLYGPGGAYGKNYDPNGDGELTEGELVWELKNNAWYYTDPITNYWNQFNNVVPNPWMNNYNKAMFESSDAAEAWDWELKKYIWADSAGNIIENPESSQFDTLMIVDSTTITMTHEPFPFFVEENTWNMDPGIVNMENTDELLAQNCINIRNDWAGEEVTHIKWHNVESYLDFTWPLPFDLSYTNQTLLSAGTDGNPLGARRWWGTATGVESRAATPVAFKLEQNFPNPFNPSTSIDYTLNTTGKVKLEIYNILGKKVKTLVNSKIVAGAHSIQWDGTNAAGKLVPSGVYFYKLEMDNMVQTRKMMLIK